MPDTSYAAAALGAHETEHAEEGAPMNTALLSEYLATLHSQSQPTTEADFRRLNQMALQLAMELPSDVLAVLFSDDQTGTYLDALDVVDAVRRHTRPDDPRDHEHPVMHRPGVGRHKPRY